MPGSRNGTSNGIGFIPVNGVERVVKNIENTINRMDNIVKQNVPVKQGVIIPTKIDSTIKPAVKPDVIVKSGVIVKPKVDSIIKPIIDQIQVIESVIVTPGVQEYRVGPVIPESTVILVRRKKPKQKTVDRKSRGIVKLNRKISIN